MEKGFKKPGAAAHNEIEHSLFKLLEPFNAG